MEMPCKNCHLRREYRKYYAMDIIADDCPYVCVRYEKYKEEQEEENGSREKS